MTTEEIKRMNEKIKAALILSAEKLLEEKRKANLKMAVYHDGKIQVINARDINW